MQQLKRWTAWICALALVLTLSPAAFAATPVSSDNINDQDYRHINCRGEFSFLYANEQGGVTRVEYLHGKTVSKQDSAGNHYLEEDGGKILVEDYDASFNCLSSRTLPMELPTWGGFLAGEDYNFIITGKNNTRESDDAEVYRVTKYSKDWQRLGAASIRAVDTAEPFSGQAARMAEGNGYLYVHTAQTMYTDGGGNRHNGCMTLQIQESDMTLAGAQYYSDNQSYFAGGVVSHSFNEFILVDQDSNIVSLDHGDGYPRGVALYRYAAKAGPEPFARGGKTESAIIQKFGGSDTVTGAAVSGFAETSSGYVAAYNYDGVGDIGDRSVYLGYVSKNGLTPSATKLSGPGTAAPQLAPTGLDGGYILWNGQTTQPARGGGVEHVMDDVLHYARYSADGSVGSVQTATGSLSDCRPIYFNGKVVWYVTSNSAPIFYTLDSSGVQAYGGGSSAPSEPSTPSDPTNPGTSTTPGKPSGSGNLNLTLDVMLAPPTFSANSIVTNDGVRYVYNGSGYTQRSDGDCIATGDGWAIRSDNSLWVWTNGTEELSAPKKVLDGVRTASISGEAGCLALKTDGTLWGFRNQNLDQPEMLGKDIVQIYTSHYDNGCQYAVSNIGGLMRRYMGDNESRFTAIMYNVSAFDNNGTGDSFFIVRNFDGALYYWGDIRGEDDIITQASPQKILEKVVSFDTYNRLAITSDGCLYGIGNAKGDPEYLTNNAVVVRDGLVLKQDGTLWRIRYDYSGNSYSGLTKVAENVKLPDTGTSSSQSGSSASGTTTPGTTTSGTTTPGTTTPGGSTSNTANPFVDVPDGAYYKEAVLWALQNGVTTGVDATHFQPNATCTRGQVVTFLWRAKGCPEPRTTTNPFTDVKSGSAFYKAILWAYENNITTGTTPTTFNPGGTCTNGHVLTFLWRSNGQPAASGSSSLANRYPGQYFTSAVAWAESKGLLNNGGSGLTPSAQCPRSDIVTYLYRNAANNAAA